MRRRCNIDFGDQNLPSTMLRQGHMDGCILSIVINWLDNEQFQQSPANVSHWLGGFSLTQLWAYMYGTTVGLGIIYTSEFQERQGTSSEAAVTCICNIEHWLCRRLSVEYFSCLGTLKQSETDFYSCYPSLL